MIKKPKADYANVDWSLNDGIIAAQLGRSQTSVMRYRMQHHPETISPKRTLGPPRKLLNIRVSDWKMSDGALAEKYHVSRPTIRARRREAGQPSLPRGPRVCAHCKKTIKEDSE